MNLFTFDEPYLIGYCRSEGDFFFVFDQAGSYLPPYRYILPDIEIMGKSFSVRYNDKENGKPRQMRRIIVKDNEKLIEGKLNLKIS